MAKEFCKRGIEAIAVYSSVEDTFAGERAAGDHYRLEYSDDCIVYFDMRLIDLFKEIVYHSIGREFLSLIETTDMQKVYKMPILYSFYNHGNIRLAVTDEEVLESWKEFFNIGTNWKDLVTDMSYSDYKEMTDRQHLSKAKSMPIKFLKASGKGFFIDKEGYALAIRDELAEIAEHEAFKQQMQDILAYRTMEYYRRRYADR